MVVVNPDTVINVANNEVGYLEKKNNAQLDDKLANAGKNNFTKYARDYNVFAKANLQGQPWCDIFIDWCFVKAFGVTIAKELLGGFSAYTPTSAKYFQNKKQWTSSNPKKGDIIFFKNSQRICHTGLVYKVSGSTVYTIEGNTSGASGVIPNGGGVMRKSYMISNKSIAGYGRPRYSESTIDTPVETTPVVLTLQVRTYADPQTYIWNFLSAKLSNKYAVAGIMGNLQAESGYNSKNLQNSYERKIKMNDTQYTNAVDNGSYKNFTKDSAGYGIAQWTYGSRKEALKKYTDSKKVSIGDLQAQLEFLYMEMGNNKSLMNALKSAKNIASASSAFMLQFEKPANQSKSNQEYRAKLGAEVYKKYTKSTPIVISTSKNSSLNTFIVDGLDYKYVFNPTYYRSTYPDLKNMSDQELFTHFMVFGMKELRQGSSEFNPRVYISFNSDLQSKFKEDYKLYYQHYIIFGRSENRRHI